jgi:hypothetical protein
MQCFSHPNVVRTIAHATVAVNDGSAGLGSRPASGTAQRPGSGSVHRPLVGSAQRLGPGSGSAQRPGSGSVQRLTSASNARPASINGSSTLNRSGLASVASALAFGASQPQPQSQPQQPGRLPPAPLEPTAAGGLGRMRGSANGLLGRGCLLDQDAGSGAFWFT